MKPLTPRQRQVIACAADGLTTRQTATRLGIAYHTARTHRDAAMRKLHVHKIAQAVALVARRDAMVAYLEHPARLVPFSVEVQGPEAVAAFMADAKADVEATTFTTGSGAQLWVKRP